MKREIELDNAATEYSAKYNNLDTRIPGEDAQYSCDGCDQNIKALAEAFRNGAAWQLKRVLEALSKWPT